MENMTADIKKNEILCDIRQKILELKSLYPYSGIKVYFNVPGNCVDPGKIKAEITESF